MATRTTDPIERLARHLHNEGPNRAFNWDEMSETARDTYRARARTYAEVLLGAPTVTVEHGVRDSRGRITAPYKVRQHTISADVAVARTLTKYPRLVLDSGWTPE